MVSLKERFQYSEFYRIFNLKDELSKGRCVILLNTFILSIVNIYITGVFYTGFLTVNGIDIIRVGIIAFIPYIAWSLSIFSPVLLSKFKKRRMLVLFNHIFYYICVVLATTLMPFFVKDSAQRTFWFAFFLFLGNVSNALIGSGVTAWHMKFLPEGYDRNVYFSYQNLISSVVGTFIAIVSSVVLDSLKGSLLQGRVITILRLIAVVVFIIDGFLVYLIPREFPYTKSKDKIKVSNIIIIPLHAKKFILTAIIMISWNFISNVNSNTWNYYVLNTVGVGYTYMFVGSVVNAIGGIFLLRYWRKAIIRYSSFNIIFFTIFITGLLEVFIAFATSQTKWVYVVVSVLQGLNFIGVNLVFANLFYMNLPKENTDVFTTFWNFTANISILAGSVLGTLFISLTEKHGQWILFGLPFYGSQFLVWIKFILFMVLCVYLKLIRKQIIPDT